MQRDVVSRFAWLFAGREDAHGLDGGGCSRVPPDYAAHLRDGPGIGIYPMVPRLSPPDGSGVGHLEWVVRFGCVDLDVQREGKRRWDYDTTEQGHVAAFNLKRACNALGMEAWVELTRSRGFHVWVFAEEWVPASWMRRALLVACQVADVPPTEVNPKSEGFAEPETLGNYVRTVYPNGFNEWALDEREPAVASGSTRGRGQLLPDEEEEWGVPRDLVADDGSGRGRARGSRCGCRWVDPARPEEHARAWASSGAWRRTSTIGECGARTRQ